MASIHRAFTTRISKQNAAEARKNVSGYQMVPKSETSSIYSSSISLNELVDPIDYEDFIAQHMNLISRDPLRSILDFPANDVQVLEVNRKIRTTEYITPKEEDLPMHVQNCVDCYTRPWKYVEFAQRHFSSSSYIRESLRDKENLSPSLYQQEFEIDRDYMGFDDTLVQSTDSFCNTSSRQSITSLSSVSTCTDTLTPRGSWSSFDLRSSVNDALIPGILDRVPQENIDQANESRRAEERQEALFSLCIEDQDEGECIERRLPAEMPMEHLGNRIFIKCLHLKLELEVEPIFASMAIYDAKEKKKLSENFYFDLNSEHIKKMLNSHITYSDISTQARSAIFEITHPSHDLFLVIRLEKVLQGDIKDSVEPYMKETNRDKAKSNAADYCDRLGLYRMPFAWTGIYLTNIFSGDNTDKDEKDRDSLGNVSASSSNSLDRKSSTSSFDQLRRKASDMGTLTRRGSLERTKRRSWSPDDFANSVENFKPIAITVSSFFKQESDKMKDEDLYKFLPELKRPGAVMKKYKCIPGSIKLEISPCPDDLQYVLTPELAKIDPYPDDTTRPIKEILEFPSLPIFNPHYAYRNILYISPKDLNFSTRVGSARNIAIRIQLMAGEKQEDAVNAIFAKSSSPEFCSEAYTSVNYHNKTPAFYDEIKIALPANLKQNHHILFTLFHVSCQKKPQEAQASVETPVGFTWLPILQDGRLNVGEFNLPIMLETPPENYSFIPPDVQLPGTKWLDNHRAVFLVNISPVTTCHSLDPYLDKFIFLCDCLDQRKVPPRIGEGNMEREFKIALHELQKSSQECLVKNLQVIMDKLLELLVTTYKIGGQILQLGPVVFETICELSDKLSFLQEERHGRQTLLSSYIQFSVAIPHPLHSKFKFPEETLNRSSSNPDMFHSEIARILDRTASMKIEGDSPTVDGLTRLLHEEIVHHWIMASGTAAKLSLCNSWMLFELIIKSMIEHLDYTNALTSPRKSRFPHQFTEAIQNLVHSVTTKIIADYSSDPKLAESVNGSLAFFIFDLLSIMDRGFVFSLVKIYFKVITSKSSIVIPELILYKLDFLRIVCCHEHFIALNLPFATPYTTLSAACSPTPSTTSNNSQNSFISGAANSTGDKAAFGELSHEYRQQHFLIGLMLTELAQVLDISNPSLHGRAIRSIKNLMTSHDFDARLGEMEAKQRVAALYIPLLGIVMNTIPQFHSFYLAEDHYQLDDYQGPVNAGAQISPEIASLISGSRLYSYIPDPVKSKTQLSSENTRSLLACFLWVIKNLEHNIFFKWASSLSPHRLHQMLQVLNVCLPCFEYKGRKKVKMARNTPSFRKSTDMKDRLVDLEQCIRGTSSARNDLIQRRSKANSNEKYRFRKDQMFYRVQTSECSNKNDMDLEINHYIEGSLSTEICLIILDALELIVQVASQSEVHNNLLGTVLKVLLHALSRNQSTLALQNIFSSQRSLVFKYHNLLFDEETDNCADLCLLLLKHCSSTLPTVRSQSAASLYLLMRQNFESYGNNFARIKMQVTMSLSSLVGTCPTFSEQSLRRAFKTILVYVETEAEDLQETTFPEQVKDLLFNLHMILSDTVKMKEYQEDPEMLLDLMNRIAKGYQNSPDLRLTWLENMAKKHSERGNHTEAAMCYVHSSALVSEYLGMLESQTHLPIGAVSFKHISPNTLSESAVSDDVLNPGEDGICLGNRFTESGLKSLLESASNSFQIAGMYETMNEVYKVLIPISEANRDFPKLAIIHGKLQEAFNRISQLHGKRVFGTYFRVGFYGHKFGDLDQQEFVYKEPSLTKLSEICSRLQSFYADRFGNDNVLIIKDSNTVDNTTLDSDKVYIQITYVEPYFETYELRKRETYFERNFNIKRFIFAIPFTKSGKAHGELHEQCKKKTILTTSNHFPYVKTRIQVVARQSIILEPIEVAIEDIQKKTAELAAATTQEPADPKILQMVLQGCIGTTVNQGPMEMALVFLSGISDGTTIPTKHQNKLRLCFKDFSKKCHDALKKNKNLIMPDQKDYQKELERNYATFTQRLAPLISISPVQATGIVSGTSGFSKSTKLPW